jgi:hypothetical protein
LERNEALKWKSYCREENVVEEEGTRRRRRRRGGGNEKYPFVIFPSENRIKSTILLL